MTNSSSGKTYLAAFDALNFNPKRLLYIAHEGSILKKSLETFREVFGGNVSYGIFSGESKEMDADFIFATNLTMCRSLELFSRQEFDYVIIDECHYATAQPCVTYLFDIPMKNKLPDYLQYDFGLTEKR